MSSEETRLLSVNVSSELAVPPMMSTESMEEPRFANRRQTRIPAYISHSTMPQSIAVLLRDYSSSGARLELAATKDQSSLADRLPARFVLNIPLDRTTVECDIAWRRGTLIGVRFISPTRNYPKPPSRVQKQDNRGTLAKMLGFGN